VVGYYFRCFDYLQAPRVPRKKYKISNTFFLYPVCIFATVLSDTGWAVGCLEINNRLSELLIEAVDVGRVADIQHTASVMRSVLEDT